MIRADMDGLPVLENNGLSYASRARQVNLAGEDMPVMHACGHDMHMTSLVGTTKMLMDNRDKWSGTVMLVGQPAEEIINGAKEMIADGLYERWGVPDYGIGLHVSSGLPTGQVTVREGITNSSTDSVDIKMRGIGGHGAYPQQTVDPIYMSSQLVIALQGIVSRQISPQAPAVITVGSMHGGSKHNIISNEVDLQLTVRTDSEEVRAQVLQAIEDTAVGIARMNGIPNDLLPIVSVGFESTATNVNDDATVQRLLPSWTEQLGYNPLISTPRPGMGGEDFSEYGQTEHDVPTVFFSVGGTPADVMAEIEAGTRGAPPHHSQYFVIDPESVKAGVEATYTAAIELLNSPAIVAQEKTVADGVFSEAQVESGKAVYDNTCSACHRMQEYRQVLRAFEGNSIMMMWELIVATMPADNPGSLADDEYTNIIAYILSDQGFPTGEAELDPYSNMEDIKIVAP